MKHATFTDHYASSHPHSETGQQRAGMEPLPKVFLILSTILFAVSLTGPGGDFYYGAIRPLSAVLFILFLVTNYLAKEVKAYDAEQARKLELYEKHRGRA